MDAHVDEAEIILVEYQGDKLMDTLQYIIQIIFFWFDNLILLVQ